MKKMFIIQMVFIVFTCIPINMYAQVCAPIPVMFVNKNVGNERNIEFFKALPSKYEILTAANGKQDLVLNFTRKAIDDLFTKINIKAGLGIRIYFARYKLCAQSSLPNSIVSNQLILLFSTEYEKIAPAVYFFINSNDNTIYTVTTACARDWINDYDAVNEPGLRQTVDKADTYNEDPHSSAGYSDTKSIFYTYDNIKAAFENEEKYQHSKGIEINAFQVSFSAYTKKGNDRKPYYKNRLFLQFDYVYGLKGKNEVLYLEDQEDFDCRIDATLINQKFGIKRLSKEEIKKLSRKEKISLISLDNGQLCPTYCPPTNQ